MWGGRGLAVKGASEMRAWQRRAGGVVVAGAAAVLGAAGAVAGVAAVLALAGGLAGVGVSCLPHAPSSSTPARVALYNAVVRIERFIGTPVAMTWPVPIHGGCRSVVRMPWSGYRD